MHEDSVSPTYIGIRSFEEAEASSRPISLDWIFDELNRLLRNRDQQPMPQEQHVNIRLANGRLEYQMPDGSWEAAEPVLRMPVMAATQALQPPDLDADDIEFAEVAPPPMTQQFRPIIPPWARDIEAAPPEPPVGVPVAVTDPYIPPPQLILGQAEQLRRWQAGDILL